MARNIDREGPIQAAIVEYLRIQYPNALLFSVPNELASKVVGWMKGKDMRGRHAGAQKKAKAQGMLAGMADICFVADGVFFAFEVKAKGNYQQPNQKAAQLRVENNGGHYFVVRSIDDVKAAIDEVEEGD